MRRLPVYLLLDTSGSMTGEPIEAVKNGVQMMMHSLRQNPQAIETAYVSIITFDSDAKQVVPLTDLASFQMVDIKAQGVTALGSALSLLADKLQTEITKTTLEQKGDWKPMTFIMTDGIPTDDWQSGLKKLKSVNKGLIVGCAAGSGADDAVLRQITESVVRLDNADSESISKFFQWVTASISTSSTKVEESGKEVTGLDQLPPPPSELVIVA
ncbi:VWA domain-containing protein [Parapedobacter sp. 2B3]|uniref:vWA domain-containing protein n=1 Tax=Parapedobacter sp. 2B3 TaxID=3342381 RepID=UPI0035B67A7E